MIKTEAGRPCRVIPKLIRVKETGLPEMRGFTGFAVTPVFGPLAEVNYCCGVPSNSQRILKLK